MLSYVVLLTLSLLVWTQAEELYSDKYDYIDVDGILQNDRLRDQYYICFMDIGPCLTADAIFFKEHIGEAFLTKCKKCTEKQKMFFDKVAGWFHDNQPEKWNSFVDKVLDDFKNAEKL